MELDKRKSGLLFGDSGGMFLGRKIETDYLRNRFYTAIASLGGMFEISSKHFCGSVSSVLISPNLHFRITAGSGDHVAFVHIDPYSVTGLKLKRHNRIMELPGNWFDGRKEEISRFFRSDVSRQAVDGFLTELVESLPEDLITSRIIDSRVLNCIAMINGDQSLGFDELASASSLSVSRLSHLFKEETDITLKQYIQHRKMINSIYGIDRNLSLTEAAYFGGFSDQPHFNNVFRKMFGIRPSKMKR